MNALYLAAMLVSGAAAREAWNSSQPTLYLLAAFMLAAVVAVYTLPKGSAFLKIIATYFLTSAMACGAILVTKRMGIKTTFALLDVSESYVITMAMFVCLARLVYFAPIARTVMTIADRYFHAEDVVFDRTLLGMRVIVSERLVGLSLMVVVLMLNQLEVYISVRLSFVSSALLTSMQNSDQTLFWHVIFVGMPSCLVPWVIVTLCDTVAAGVLFIRWRSWLAHFYERSWLGGHRHYAMGLSRERMDNPDQRIQEDIPFFIGQQGSRAGGGVYDITLNLIANLSSLASFSIILWGLSTGLAVPGFLLWFAMVYALIGTGLASLIGRALIPLAFARQHYEADYRFGLSRLREYSEQIALQAGEATERWLLRTKFAAIASNFYQHLWVSVRLSTFMMFFARISYFVPYIMMGGLFFAHKRSLGDLAQTEVAFISVNTALTFFINYYKSLAEFRSVLNRLTSFDAALGVVDRCGSSVGTSPASCRDFTLSDVKIVLPGHKPLLTISQLSLLAGENVIITGPTGSGKSSLLRILAGIWPYWDGVLTRPEGVDVLALPQKPYVPTGTLRAALSYPHLVDRYEPEAVRRALIDVKLDAFVGDLDVEDNWTQRLSGGELQRIAIARALLSRPDWLLLDEATAAMDPMLEQHVYEVLRSSLPETTIVSIAHRETLHRFHDRHVVVDRRSIDCGTILEQHSSSEIEEESLR